MLWLSLICTALINNSLNHVLNFTGLCHNRNGVMNIFSVIWSTSFRSSQLLIENIHFEKVLHCLKL